MSGYNMNNIDPFGFGQRQSAPTEGSEQQPNSFGEQMSQLISQPMAGGQGIMGDLPIRQYLMPLLGQISDQMEEEKRNKIEPYLQEVQQLTDQTFPDLSLSGGGLRGGLGSLFGGGMGGPAVDFMTPNIGSPFGFMNQFQGGLDPMSQNQVSKPMQSPPNQNLSPFGTASFFR